MKYSSALKLAAGTLATALSLTACGGSSSKNSSTTTSVVGSTTSTTAYASPELPASTAAPLPPTTTTTTKKPTTTTSTTRPRAPATTTHATYVDQKTALARLVSAYPTKSYVISAVVHTGGLSYVALAHDVGQTSSVIDIYLYQGTAFVAVTHSIGAGQSLDPVDPSTIVTANITRAQFSDFLVPLAAGGHDNGVLVSFAGGFWHLVGPSDRIGAAASPELVQPTIVGNEIKQSVNNCNPTCAQGTYSVTTYAFDSASGKLVPIGPTLQSSTP